MGPPLLNIIGSETQRKTRAIQMEHERKRRNMMVADLSKDGEGRGAGKDQHIQTNPGEVKLEGKCVRQTECELSELA